LALNPLQESYSRYGSFHAPGGRGVEAVHLIGKGREARFNRASVVHLLTSDFRNGTGGRFQF